MRRLEPGLARLLATLGAFALALLPHVPRLPAWVTAALAGALAWRLVAEHRGWALPPRWLRLAAALAATLGILLGYRTLNGLEAGTALLAIMAGVKLTETREPRDHAVLVFIGYFLCLAALLQQQSFVRLAWVVLVCWLLTAALARVHRPVEANSPVRPFRTAGRLLLLGLPLAAVLFVFVPRIEGRFWALPSASAEGRTGIDETMSPGDIASLGLSDEPAFRAWFDGPVPTPEQRYWRVLVLEGYDGRTWRRVRRSDWRQPALELRGEAYSYRIALEPTQRVWLAALEHVGEWPSSRALRTRHGQLVSWEPGAADSFDGRPVTDRLVYAARSWPEARVDVRGLARDVAALNLELPAERHPRTRALAARLRAAARDERDYVARVLERFATEEYAYTLEPLPAGPDAVDGFLFDTREGFCEHYAAAFAVLMRAAGIPTRVVTGYQGGEWNAYGEYLLVRESTAHAWNEIWLPDAGWVRVDPTAAVAPERIRRGLGGALGAARAPGRVYAQVPWLGQLRAAFDAARTAWYERVVGFDPAAQQRLLARLGLGGRGWQGLALALAVGFGLAALALAGWLAWELRPRVRDPVLAAWQRVCARAAARGHARALHEGPVDWARRVQHADPALGRELRALAEAYARARYLPSPADEGRRFVTLASAWARRR